MKKIFSKLAILLVLGSFAIMSCHNDIWDAIDGLDNRVTKLEELCKQMNQDVASLKTIVDAISSGDYITNIIEIKQGGEVVGYSITFSKHDPITIYSGANGKNGENGKDGQTPVIGVAQEDGVYYWTLNGQWLLDANGNKVRVTGEDGAKGDEGDKGDKGETGATGQTGANGSNGTNGVTPQLKIEDGYWYVSYDNGSSWTEVGRATGNNGTNGTDGEDGDSMFSDVSFDDYYVYITLVDGTILPVVRASNGGGPGSIIEGAIQSVFKVAQNKEVHFSQGLLQYNAIAGSHLCADGTNKAGIWRFAASQLETLGSNYQNASSTYDGWFDRFSWATSGNVFQPYDQELSNPPSQDISGNNANYDWGVYNSISNGGGIPNVWRTLTSDEWHYILYERPSAERLRGMCKIKLVTNTYVSGMLIFPDNFVMPGDMWWFPSISFNTTLNIHEEEWNSLSAAGAVFLPAETYYWTASTDLMYPNSYSHSFVMYNISGNSWWTISCEDDCLKSDKLFVRLVKDVQ